MRKSARISLVLLVVLSIMAIHGMGQRSQTIDATFSTKVTHPAVTDRHPRVGIDESHRNFHTGPGLLDPLRHLLEADGFEVSAAPRLEPDTLKNIDILVIANATGVANGSAFTPAECDAVRDWVRDGGALLLIADHSPYGEATVAMAKEFGVDMKGGFVTDPQHSGVDPTWLMYSSDNGLLADHAILRGRSPAEKVRRVETFTGQSLIVPENAAPLLKLGTGAAESPYSFTRLLVGMGLRMGTPVTGRAQGLVMKQGRGRVAVFGDAALFSAQIVSKFGQGYKVGMNAPGNDDRQFALNVMHWLAGLIE